MATKKTKQVSQPYELSLTLGDKIYKSKGSSIIEALDNIKPMKNIKAIGEIAITYQGKLSKIPIKLLPDKLDMILAKPIDRAVFAKRISVLM